MAINCEVLGTREREENRRRSTSRLSRRVAGGRRDDTEWWRRMKREDASCRPRCVARNSNAPWSRILYSYFIERMHLRPAGRRSEARQARQTVQPQIEWHSSLMTRYQPSLRVLCNLTYFTRMLVQMPTWMTFEVGELDKACNVVSNI